MNNNYPPASEMSSIPRRLLLGPGPSNVHPRVLQAMMAPMIGYLDRDFIPVLKEISDRLRSVFRGNEKMALAISGAGSAGMEAGLTSLLEPNQTAIICVNGFFCERMVEMATRIGANVIPLRSKWGHPFPPEILELELKKHSNVKLVAAIHAETSTGILQPLNELSRISKEYGALFMVDAVTSVGGCDIDVDRLNIDYCYSAAQKCLSCPPGISPCTISTSALQSIERRKTKPSSWYLDLSLIANYWGPEHIYHHTVPVSMLLALREGLRIVMEEGIDNRIARHQKNAAALTAGLEALGLDIITPQGFRLPQVTPIWIPQGINDLDVRETLLNEYDIEIGRGLGEFAGKVWRIGLMGETSRGEYVLAVLSALENILPKVGFEIASGAGVTAASNSLAQQN